MTNERLKQLLIKCMNWIEYDNDDVANTFEHLGFSAKELTELGFWYVSKKRYYYDVVVSICTETERTDSDVICGGFATKEDAIKYINDNGISEVDYYSRCREDETAYIEIEERDDETGTIVDVTTID